MWRRFGSDAHLSNAEFVGVRPDGIKPLTAEEIDRRQQSDDLHTLTTVMDPSLWAFLDVLGIDVDDMAGPAINMLKSCATVEFAPEAAGDPGAGVRNAQSARAKEKKKELDAVGKLEKGRLQTQEAWVKHKESLCEAIDQRYAGLAEGLGAFDDNPMSPLQEDLMKEIEKLKVFIRDAQKQVEHRGGAAGFGAAAAPEFTGLKDGAGRAGWNVFGDPFDNKVNYARYGFWIEHQEEFPLLYFLATMVLGVPATSTECERLHSVTGRILARFRKCMKPEQTERLTMAYMMWKNMIEQDEVVKSFQTAGAAVDLAEVDAYLDLLLAEDEESSDSDA